MHDLPPVPNAAADRRQAHYATQSLLALALYAGYAAVFVGGALAGLLPMAHAALLSTAMLGVGSVAYLLLRLRLVHRPSDPSLTLPQCVWGVLCTGVGYCLHPQARGAVLTLLLLVLAFGMFSLTPRQSRTVSIAAAVSVIGATAFNSWHDPVAFPLTVEASHLAISLVAIWGNWVLSARMAGLRSHVRRQKSELREALGRIQTLATRDELTGLHNRRHMRELMSQARGSGGSTGIALIDIDLFKRINDEHGHAAGDRVLSEFAGAARRALREGDVVARWGGEEFLIMLPATPLPQAEQVLARLREQVGALPLHEELGGRRLTFSAGLVEWCPQETLDAAIERADKAMYTAKQAGRDRLVVQREPAAAPLIAA